MLPKILRIRLDADGRVSVAGAAVAIRVELASLLESGAPQTQKAAVSAGRSGLGKRSFKRPDTSDANAWNALRDDASCSGESGEGRDIGGAIGLVKAPRAPFSYL